MDMMNKGTLDWRLDVLINVSGRSVTVSDAQLKRVEIELINFISYLNNGRVSNEVRKSYNFFMEYYHDNKTVNEIADKWMVSSALVKNRIISFTKLLGKYWWMNPHTPIAVNKLNEIVLRETGDMDFLDSMHQVGICTIEDCILSVGAINKDYFNCIPYVNTNSRDKLYAYLSKAREEGKYE